MLWTEHSQTVPFISNQVIINGLHAVARYQTPTAIQAQGLPAALSGRDILVNPLARIPGR